VFIVTPQQELIADWDNRALLGDGVEIHAVQPLLESVSPGETLTFFLAMRVHQTPTQAYRFFVHLQNEPTPYEGGTQWATGDAPLCAQVYNPVWDTGETIVQTLTLPIPADLVAGTYHVAIGIYDPESGARLTISPAQNEYNYYGAFRFSVE
jgi:hypothetical protein